MYKILGVLICACAIYTLSEGAEILGVFHHPGKSHHSLGETLLKALVSRGHKVTMISPFPLKVPVVNYTDINLSGFLEEIQEPDQEEKYLEAEQSVVANIHIVLNLTRYFTERCLKHPEVHKLLKGNKKFDLVIMDWFLNEAELIFGYLFQAPVIGLASFGTVALSNGIVGNSEPYSYVPVSGLPYSPHMTLFERTKNTLLGLYYEYLFWKNIEEHDNILRRTFKNAPPVTELRKNFALMLSNGHYSFEAPRPFVPNMIPIGGFHVQKPKGLKKELKEFLDGATHGAVYFSLGSHFKSSLLPKDKIQEIINAFSKLPLRVVAKWDAVIENVPENVMFEEWFPQNDILAHPNVKVFVTHSGLLSTIEGVYHGVPMVGIPLFGDQKTVVQNSISNGIAIQIYLNDLKEDTLTAAFNEILNNTSYSTNARKRSILLRNQPLPPLDTAIHWIEHVLQFKGASHLKNAGAELKFYQYLLLDVAAFLLGCITVILTILYVSVKKLFAWCRPQRHYTGLSTKKIKKQV